MRANANAFARNDGVIVSLKKLKGFQKCASLVLRCGDKVATSAYCVSNPPALANLFFDFFMGCHESLRDSHNDRKNPP
ncbi:hypothetical protein [Helicobacter sp. MIT 01-3238]|uniref:hypothetical protein n=1 Tax=Helicobacter sp. MIT 01-3238 TaxID=398627 RepID=UPI000E1F8FC5|nr:hypothetical protein [Helicobacter sp. MIT 01-3238]RDU54319.1 hypothetical protein CQA40_03825 [Helicobacter sp. MIT 01-3238]